MKSDSSKQIASLESMLESLEVGLDPPRVDAFLDELTSLVHEAGHVICSTTPQGKFRLQSGETILGEAAIQLAVPKFRSICARLAVRCREWSGEDVSLYGDEVEFEHPDTNVRYKVKFENRAGSQRIEIRH